MWSSRREDPKVRIELPIEPDVFSCDLDRATKSNFQRGKKVHHVQNINERQNKNEREKE